MGNYSIKSGSRNNYYYPEVREVVLIVGDEKNRGVWRKGLVLRHIRGRDGVVRGVVLQYKGNTI